MPKAANPRPSSSGTRGLKDIRRPIHADEAARTRPAQAVRSQSPARVIAVKGRGKGSGRLPRAPEAEADGDIGGRTGGAAAGRGGGGGAGRGTGGGVSGRAAGLS